MLSKRKTILIASDSFKGSLSAKEIVDAFKCAQKAGNYPFDIKGMPIADGGEGTLDVILQSGQYNQRCVECANPLFEKTVAKYAIKGDVAIVELAQSAGITLIEHKQNNAMHTTSYGVGEVVRDAICNGAKHIYLCVGGSATNDGGIGALSALGYEFLDENGKKLPPIGENLEKIAKVKKIENIADCVKFTIVADVDNPLVGKNGATYVYGPQKGLLVENLEKMDNGMRHFADITQAHTGVRIHDMKGAGAAGGVAGGFMAYFGAYIQSGIECVLNLINFDEALKKSDIVITGEGKIDEQSLCGKAIWGVCKRAKSLAKDVYIIAGCNALEKEQYEKIGINGIFALSNEAICVQDSINNAKKYAQIVADKLLKHLGEVCYE